jgi:hypothetical protein
MSFVSTPFHDIPAPVELRRRFRGGDTDPVCLDEHTGVGRVHHGCVHPAHPGDVEHVPRLARGQQLSGAGAARLAELEVHGGAATGDARYLEGAGAHELGRVGVVNDDPRLVPVGVHQRLVDREGSHGRGHIAAVAVVVHRRIPNRDLREGEIDVGLRMGGRTHDADLGKRRDAPAHAVQLTGIRVGAADGGEEDRVPRRPIGRQVLLPEHDRFAGAAAHEHGRDLALSHAASRAALRPAMRPNTAPETSPVPPG